MRSPSRPKAVAEAEEVLLVNGVQHGCRRTLDDLVLQRRDRQRSAAPLRLGYVDPPAGRRPVGPAVDPRVQVCEPSPQVRLVLLPPHAVDPGRGVFGYTSKRRLQGFGRDVMQQRGEPLLLVTPCGLPYALQRL